MSSPAETERRHLPDVLFLGMGLAVLRIFFGVILLLNGLAKLFNWHSVSLGPYQANLINRDDAEFILRYEVFENPAGNHIGTRIPGLRDMADFMLDNWGFFQWAVTFFEVGVGLLLVIGLATRGAALLALGMQLQLALVYATSNRWMFEQPHEYIPLIILALVPTGRVWGLDAKVLERLRRPGAERTPKDLVRTFPF